MNIVDFLTPERIVLDAKPRDKAQLISDAARLFGKILPGFTIGAVEAALLVRERLGSTGLGAGFALPHARIDGLDDYFGMVFRLGKPIDFGD